MRNTNGGLNPTLFYSVHQHKHNALHCQHLRREAQINSLYDTSRILHYYIRLAGHYPGWKWLIQCTVCSCTCAMVHTRLQFLAIQAFLIASVMYSRFMEPCNSSHTLGSRYLGYGLVLYTPIILCHPVRILGNDYPGMGTVVRLHKSAVHGCMRAAWWYICTWECVAGVGICMQ